MKLKTTGEKTSPTNQDAIIISATFFATSLLFSLKPLLQKFSNASVRVTYNDFPEQFLNTNSLFHSNKKGINVLLFRFKDLHQKDISIETFKENLNKLIEQITAYNETCKIPLILCCCPQEHSSFKELENNFLNIIREKNLGYVIENEDIQYSHHITHPFDKFGENEAHIPYVLDFFQVLGQTIARIYYTFIVKPKKVIVLDCDDTIWQGKIGEDGLDGIVINEQRRFLQQFFLEKFQQGFLLCLCSRNNEDDVWRVFDQKKEMILKKEHITGWRINWHEKSKNIISLSQSLNLSLDSFIFIDDDPAQIGEVTLNCPEVLSLQLPNNENLIPPFLHAIWGLETFGNHHNEIGSLRSNYYKNTEKRAQLQRTTSSFSDFLKQLDLKVTIRPIDENDFNRVSELMQRSNQFNFHKWEIDKCDKSHLKYLINFENYHVLVVDVVDCYDNYGLVGVILYSKTNNIIVIESFILSCRALSKGVEHQMLKNLGDIVLSYNQDEVLVIFKPTPANKPALYFLEQMGFKKNEAQKDLYSISATKAQNAAPTDWHQKNKENETSPIALNTKSMAYNEFAKNIVALTLEEFGERNTVIKTIHTQPKTLPKLISSLKKLVNSLVPIIDPNVSFVESGCDSLLAIHLASLIYNNYNIHLQYTYILSPRCNLNSLGQLIFEKVHSDRVFLPSGASLIQPLPLSLEQERLWSFYFLNENNAKYNMSIVFQLEGNLNLEALELAFNFLLQNETIFSTSFSGDLHHPFQYIEKSKSDHFEFNVIKEPKKEIITEALEQWINKPFNLKNDLLLRVQLFQIMEEKYVLGICIPHIINDAVSLHLLTQRLSHYYTSFIKGKTPDNKCLYHYRDYLAWQSEDPLISSNTEYWKNQLSGKIQSKLPFMKNIAASYQSNRITFEFDESLSLNVKELAVKSNTTLYQVLLTVFGVLLSKYTRQQDVIILTPTAGRQYPHSDEIIGFFINLVLLSFQIEEDNNFFQTAKIVQEVVLNSLEHQNHSFIDALSFIKNSSSSMPISFIFQNYETVSFSLEGVRCTREVSNNELLFDVASETRLGPVAMYMGNRDNKLIGLVEYDEALFDEESIKSLIKHFESLLNKIAASPETPVLNHSLLAENEIEKLFLWSNYSNTPHVGDIISIFQKQVIDNPNHIAVSSKEGELSYLELDKRSSECSYYLKNVLTLASENCIAICLPRNLYEAIAILGVIKSGCAYVPINRNDPIERIQYILKDTEAKAIIVTRSTLAFFNLVEIKKIIIDHPGIYTFSYQFSFTKLKDNQLAYVMYTSGSTGQPKGVLIEQRSISRLVTSPNYIEFQPEDRIAQLSNTAFDASTFEFWGGLLNGATLVYPPSKVLSDFSKLSNFLSDQCITIAWVTAALMEELAFINPSIFKSLNYLLSGGDVLNPKGVFEILNCLNGKPKYFINGYGPTENTTFTTTYKIETIDHQSIPIGKAIQNTEIYVLDTQNQPVPIGIPGMLYIGGIGLARGYLNKPDLTNAKFLEIEVAGKKRRLYQTGDFVYWGNDGNLHYLGRIDNQIKLRGYLIDISEIEQKLLSHPSIKQAIVLVYKTESLNKKKLITYFTTYEDEELHQQNLIEYLNKILPEYLIPTKFIQVKHLPTTVNGKIDRKALLVSEPRLETENHISDEHTPTEKKLISLVGDILSISGSFNLNLGLTEIGFTSINLISLLQKIRHAFEIDISASILWGMNSLLELAKFIDIKKEQTSKIYFVEIQAGNPKKNNPLILIHPAGGNTHCYQELIKSLDKDQPCYVIEDKSLIKKQVLWENIFDIATYYLKIITKCKPEWKEIIIGGWSFGGMVASEMANQHEKAGSKNFNIKFVLLLDTWVVSDLQSCTREILKRNIISSFSAIEINETDSFLLELFTIRQEQGFSYRPSGTINTPIFLFKANESDAIINMEDSHNYWLPYAKQLKVFSIEGNHHSLLQYPYVQNLAKLISIVIKQQSRSETSVFRFFQNSETEAKIENDFHYDYS